MSNVVINPYNFAVGGAGGWVELGRITLGSESNTITVSGLAAKEYLMVLTQGQTAQTNADLAFRFNGDSGASYAARQQWNGGGDNTYINQNQYRPSGTVLDLQFLNIDYISNLSSKEKLVNGNAVDNLVSGSGTAPTREEHVAKWVNTSSSINEVEAILINGTPNFRVGSEVVVLGYDPTDTHTSGGFWEELATASGAGATLDTGTFAAKKYLWVQGYCNPSSSTNIRLNFNSDTSGNYAIRESINGGADTTNIAQASSDNLTGTSTGGLFFNMFIINNAGHEKLWISHGQENTAGATVGDRKQMVGSWSNTVDSITKIVATSNFGADSELKVWGSD